MNYSTDNGLGRYKNNKNKYVLLYHSVGSYHFSTKLNNFRKHIKFLSYFSSDFISEYNETNAKIFLTFDDGYVDNYTKVFPVAKYFNQKINIYISTKYIGREFSFSRTKGKYKVLTNKMISEMADSGIVEFGSHSHSHIDLSFVNKSRLSYEIEKSVDIIESITNTKVSTFSFPFNKININAFPILERLGIKYLLTGNQPNFVNSSISIIPRISVDRKSAIFSIFKQLIYSYIK